jgi:hypothetical protein
LNHSQYKVAWCVRSRICLFNTGRWNKLFYIWRILTKLVFNQ